MRNPGRLVWLGALFIVLLFGAVDALYAQSFRQLKDHLQAETGGRARIRIQPETGLMRFLGTGLKEGIRMKGALKGPATVERSQMDFLGDYGPLFGVVDAQRDLKVTGTSRARGERSFVRYQQHQQGIPVIGGEMIIQSVGPGQQVVSASSKILPGVDVDVSPRITPEAARQAALRLVAKHNGLHVATLNAKEPELWVYNPTVLGHRMDKDFLVWRTEITPMDPLPIRELVLVDAHRGAVILHFNQTDTVKIRQVYDANNNTNLAMADLVRSEGNAATGDADADNAYAFAGHTYDFFLNQHGRDGIDNAGGVMKSVVHYGFGYENAFWDGVQMVYGDGFVTDDVAGHEMTHGITEHTSRLFYYYQSGAINEALSDIWGEFIDLTNGVGNDSPSVRWKIGEDLPPQVGIIRDMKNPRTFGDPERMGDPAYWCGEGDNGGVHSNSGVANKAAYLLVDGGLLNGYRITGLSGGIPMAADLFYEVQTNLLSSASDYQDLYEALIQAATNIGLSDADKLQVTSVVNATQMNLQPSRCPAMEAPGPVCPTGRTTVLFSDDLESTTSGNWVTSGDAGQFGWYYPATVNPYSFDGTFAVSGSNNFWGDDVGFTADYSIAMTGSVLLPATGWSYFQFTHAYAFESMNAGVGYDGGVVEYSIDGGSTWNDAGDMIVVNGYTGTIFTGDTNTLAGRRAFFGSSHGHITTRLDITSLAGQNVRFRFRIGTDSIVEDMGWFIDDIAIFQCEAPADAIVQVMGPNGGETWQAGSLITISWNHVGSAGKTALVELLRGESVERIIRRRIRLGANGTGLLRWRIPRRLPPGDDFRIRVTTDSGKTDMSNQAFSIVPRS